MLRLEVFWRWCLPGIVANNKGGIWSIELIGAIANHIGHTILEIFGLIPIDDENTIVELVSYTDITVCQLHSICW